MKKTIILMLSLLLIMVGVNFESSLVRAEENYLLKLSTQLNESDPLVKGFKQFKKNVEKRTDGNLTIEIYPSAQLGSDEDVIEQARMGVNVGLLTDGGRMANYVNEMGIINMPYLVDNYKEVQKLVNTDLFQKWTDELSQNHDLQILSFNWYHGPRHFLTNKPIRKPGDLDGVRIRTPGSPVWQESIKALGATPVALGWNEVYTGIQQDVIDGAEGQHLASYTARLYEVIDYINKTGHFQLINGIAVSKKWFDTLPNNYQKILIEEAKSVGEETAHKVIKVAEEYENNMINEGVKVIEPDKEAFKSASKKAYKELGYMNLRNKILNLINE